MYNKIKTLGRILVDALYPPACAVCGKPLGGDSGPPGIPGVHPGCFALTLPVSEPSCCKCGKHVEDEQMYCKDCEESEHTFTQAVAAFEINPDLKDSLYRFKYKSRREYAAFFANSIYTAHKDLLRFWQPELILPIPMYYKKERARGYNQAALIARELGHTLGIPVNEEALVRTKKTAPLKDCTAFERKNILTGVFELQENITARKVLVVDDIYTTGATLDACAKVLKHGGVSEVYGANVCTGTGV